MTIQEAKQLLMQCDCCILVDSAFGDKEVSWYLGTKIPRIHIAEGYFSNRKESVTILPFKVEFKDKDAKELLSYYKSLETESNNL